MFGFKTWIFASTWWPGAFLKCGFRAGQQGRATCFNHPHSRMAIVRVESSEGIGSSEPRLSEFPEKRHLIKEQSQYSGRAMVS